MNIAPLLAIELAGLTVPGRRPTEWSNALNNFGFDEELLLVAVTDDSILASLLREPLHPEGLANGQMGLIMGPNLIGEPGGAQTQMPDAGWWPEAIRLVDSPPLVYPADASPYPVLAFFVGIGLPPPATAGTVQIASVGFPVPPTQATPQMRVWPTPDGQCGYQLSEETQFQVLTCTTLNCPNGCTGSSMTRDDERTAFLCRCPG